jgi:hypothetical protein
LHYSCFFLLLLFFPTMEKKNPKENKEQEENYERNGSTQTLTKHGT